MKEQAISTTDQNIIKAVPQSIWNELRKPTPKKFIKKRQGAGGRSFDYVEAGYIKDLLNKTFNSWSFTIVDKQIGQEQIWVQGRLTVQVPVQQPDGKVEFVSIVKEQFGGAMVKRSKYDGNKVIDIGNDLKAAASDALKKCASEWGVASDIYWGDIDEDTDTIEESKAQVRKIMEDQEDPTDAF